MSKRDWWITRYGPMGSVFCKLESLSKEELIGVITGEVEYKLEALTQEERNSESKLGTR